MRTALTLLLLLAGSALANGLPKQPDAARILHEAEAHLRKLQRLNEADTLLDVQLKIAKKLAECQQTGYSCATLEGPHTAPETAPNTSAATSPYALPQLLATYQGRAQIRTSDGRLLEIQPGTQLGPWTVRQIAVDFISLRNTAGEQLRLPLERQP